ncbi:hypothetical protein ACO0QE_002793 [Hanseniaspora vineae]
MATAALTYDKESIKNSILDSVAPVVTVSSSPELNDRLQRTLNIRNLHEYMVKYGNIETTASVLEESDSAIKVQDLQGPFSLRFAADMETLLDMPMDSPDLLQSRIKDYLFIKEQSQDVPMQDSKELFQYFFESSMSSYDLSVPLTMFNHPDKYEKAREMLVHFKNIKKTKKSQATKNWKYININDILPVFVMCYNDHDQKSFEDACALAKQLKKQLFVESFLLPIWHTTSNENKVSQQDVANLQTLLVQMKTNAIQPFMVRKIQFWNETILAHRKSLSKLFFRKFSRQSSPALSPSDGSNAALETAEEEMLLRKLGDWSFMLKDFKTAFTVYNQLVKDFNATILQEILPANVDSQLVLASTLFWSAIAIFMGAQTILTGKMIKTELDPLITRGISEATSTETLEDEVSDPAKMFIIVLKFLLPLSELFLTLSDEWLGVPYAIRWYEEILYWSNNKYGLIECFIWERLSLCFKLRVDPRVIHHIKLSQCGSKSTESAETSDATTQVPINPNKLDWGKDYIMQGHQRQRKAVFFELLAARKWLECNYVNQTKRLLLDIDKQYSGLPFAHRNELLLFKLKEKTGLI